MCGFLLYDPEGKELDAELIMDLKSTLEHRGLETNVVYNKRILAIHSTLPMTSLDQGEYFQPMERPVKWGPDFLAMFTGEIFNWKELKEQYDLDSANDSELFVDLTLKSVKNDKFLDLLHQMDGFWNFAGVAGDDMFAVTDYLSQKPLYYRTDMQAICSEPFPLSLLGPTTKDRLFYSSIPKFGYDVTGATAWNEIKQMPAGSFYENGKIKPYWSWDKVADVPLNQAIGKSVAYRLEGKREPAILLSGGLDSSIIYHHAKMIKPDIKVFHVENGEEEYVKMLTNDYTKVDLSEFTVTKTDAIRRNQTPVDLGSVVPQAQLADALHQQHLHVVLSGDGADELFSGYGRNEYYDSQYSDIFQELPYYHNPRLDRIMMGSVVELRAPFLAPYIVKQALTLDFDKRKNKSVLKGLYDGILPDKILYRKKEALKTEEVKKKSTRDNVLENIKIFDSIFWEDK